MSSHRPATPPPLALLSALLLMLCAVAPIQAQSPDAMGLPQGPVELPELVTLTERDVTGMISVGKELKALGISLESKPGSVGLDEQLAGQKQAATILRKANFTPQRLQQVAYSIGLAMAALDENFDDARAQIAEMEQMKNSMPADQWAMMQGMMGPAMKMMEQAVNQPKGNIDLARKYESELNALGE